MATRPAAFDLRGAAPTDGDTAVNGGGRRRSRKRAPSLSDPGSKGEKGREAGEGAVASTVWPPYSPEPRRQSTVSPAGRHGASAPWPPWRGERVKKIREKVPGTF